MFEMKLFAWLISPLDGPARCHDGTPAVAQLKQRLNPVSQQALTESQANQRPVAASTEIVDMYHKVLILRSLRVKYYNILHTSQISNQILYSFKTPKVDA